MKGFDSIIWTKHARERAKQYGLIGIAADLKLKKTHQVDLREKEKVYKFKKYGIKSLDNIYLRTSDGKWLFTCNKKGSTLIVITVTDRQVVTKDWEKVDDENNNLEE